MNSFKISKNARLGGGPSGSDGFSIGVIVYKIPSLCKAATASLFLTLKKEIKNYKNILQLRNRLVQLQKENKLYKYKHNIMYLILCF